MSGILCACSARNRSCAICPPCVAPSENPTSADEIVPSMRRVGVTTERRGKASCGKDKSEGEGEGIAAPGLVVRPGRDDGAEVGLGAGVVAAIMVRWCCYRGLGNVSGALSLFSPVPSGRPRLSRGSARLIINVGDPFLLGGDAENEETGRSFRSRRCYLFFSFSFFLPPALVVGNENPRGAEGRLGLDVINKKVV